MAKPKLDPQAAHEALEAIREADGQLITPDAVVDAARDPDHVLHDQFTWDDRAAAEKQRRTEARAIITTVRIWREERDLGRAYVNATVQLDDGSKRRGYMRAQDAAANPDIAKRVIASKLAAIMGVLRNTEKFAELAGLRQEVDRIVRDLELTELIHP